MCLRVWSTSNAREMRMHDYRCRSSTRGRCSHSAVVQRRDLQRGDARRSLEAARATFDQLGATSWAERARSELGRVGGRSASPGTLTTAEERIAALVAEGKSNKEVAATLFISVKTVEVTLTRVYRKLGVKSRAELAARFAEVAKQ